MPRGKRSDLPEDRDYDITACKTAMLCEECPFEDCIEWDAKLRRVEFMRWVDKFRLACKYTVPFMIKLVTNHYKDKKSIR